jgi:hypothetical protein
MTSHSSKPVPQFGFIILCPEQNTKALKSTVSSITTVYPDHPHIAVAPSTFSKEKIAELSQFCEIVKGKDTITSLLNAGMKKTKSDWNIIVFAGSWLRTSFYRIFKYAKNDKDILFPVVNRLTNFIDGSMNGIVVHKRTFEEVGPMPTIMHKDGGNDLELIKTFWSLDAMSKGCIFKAILGMKVC